MDPEGSITVLCDRHKTRIERKEEKYQDVYSFMISEAVMENVCEMLSNMNQSLIPENGPPLTNFFTDHVKLQSESGAMCCYLGDEEIDRLEREELPKYLMFGVKSEPIG